jgi:hypothetical protein
MANSIADVTPKLLAQGLMALRQNAVMPKLVNRSYDTLAAQKGAVINVPLPSAVTTYDVSPTVTLLANNDSAPTVAQVTLDFWKAAKFHLTDKEVGEAMDGIIPMQASEAIKGLANAVDSYILGKHTGFFATAGTAGTTPFATTIAVAGDARKKLNRNLAPVDDRRAVLDPDAESNLLQVANVLDFDKRGDASGIVEGSIGRKLGFDWYLDQNITTYTPGTAWVSGRTVATAGGVAGETTLAIQDKNATIAAGTIKIGDIFSLGGSAAQYVVTVASSGAASVSTAQVITFYPALASAHASAVAVTVIGTAHTVNLAFHRDAMAWASRPLGDVLVPGNTVMSATDPVSGIALRLEVSRQNKQTTFEYDILGGANVIRREYGCKILG